MKTQNTKLAFGKHALIELQKHELLYVNGGTMNTTLTHNIAQLTKQLTCGGGEDGCVTR